MAKRLERVSVHTSIGLPDQRHVTVQVCVAPPKARASLQPASAVGSGISPAVQVMCLHGFDSSCLEFRRLCPLLEEAGFQPWAVDMLGWGFTEMPTDVDYSPKAKRQLLYDFWKQYIGTPVVLMGGSIGGALAIDFAVEHPDAVAKLVLVDPQAFASLPPSPDKPPPLPAPLGFVGAAVLKSVPLRFLATRMVFHNKAEASQDAIRIGRLHCLQDQWSQALVSYMQCGGPVLLQRAVEQKMSSVAQKTLVLWGEQDTILERSNLELVKGSIDDVTVQFVDECGHQPHVEQPQAVVDALVKWCL